MRLAISPRSFRDVPGRHLQVAADSKFEITYPTVDRHLSEDEMTELVSGCRALIVGIDPVTARVMEAGPLEVVVKYGSGLDNIDLEAAKARGVDVRSTPGTNSQGVAELSIASLFALARHIVAHHQSAASGSWDRWMGSELAGRRLGVLGLGHVGRRVADMAQGIGMDVVGHDPYVETTVPTVDLDTLLSTSWAVSLHAPLTPQTRHMIGKEQLARMPSGSLLVNTARGGLVDEIALAEALDTGHLAGAALDDFEQRPDADSRLWSCHGFLASPHAGAATSESVERTGVAAVEAVLEALGR